VAAKSKTEEEGMAELTDDVRNALGGKQFWSLATLNPDGSPQNTVVWVDTREARIMVNSELGRKKPRNLETHPNVALAWFDPENPYANISIQGKVAESYGGDQADADIDALAKKYLGVDVYPHRQEMGLRVTYLIEPTHVWVRT
jgi:PPOX class probable F420-dependent enzyme